MKKSNTFRRLCMLILALALVIGQIPPVAQKAYAVEGEPVVEIDNCGSRLNAKVENIENPSYQWEISDAKNGTYTSISGATNAYYDITAEDEDYEGDEGKFIRLKVGDKTSEPTGPIGKLVVFDLSESTVTLDTTYSGKDKAGKEVSGEHAASNIYVVKQSSVTNYTTNNIVFKGSHPDAPFDLTIDGVHMGDTPVKGKTPDASGIGSYSKGVIDLRAGAGRKHVTLRLKNENIVKAIRYSTSGEANANSTFKITDINGDGEIGNNENEGGKLYIPVKKVTPEEINEFVNSGDSYNHWNSGIGGDDGSADKVTGLEIAGGQVQVLTTYTDNCTAIGAGGNGKCEMTISGGKVIAHCSGTGAAIGGGIGWHSAGGTSNVTITGGDVYAKNHGKIFVQATYNSDGSINATKIVNETDEYNEIIGGVAIGSGSSVKSSGSEGTINISGGKIEAYGTYGNGIGGGNSSSSSGGSATINITGGTITASSIGGGDSKGKVGGSATVNVHDPANVTLVDGIGGGNSAANTGGSATINVYGGTMTAGGVIGGGNGGDAGAGGEATVTVTGGTLKSASIGGGKGGESGPGGAAKITISGGNIETGSIGGGDTLDTSVDRKLGYATADISGGNISGQFLMAAGGSNPCYFKMSGGRLYGVNTIDSVNYTYAQENGAAVYMDDPNGSVEITGGVIENCHAKNGGAIYMTAGTFTMSQIDSNVQTAIRNCTATGDGGAVYLGGGSVTIAGGSVNNNSSAKSGGAVFVNGGNVRVEDGTLSKNTATDNGGAVAINNGNYTMIGGSVSGNTATNGAGGGIYVAAETDVVTVDIRSGTISNNRSESHGGAVAVVGKNDTNAKPITVTVGVNKIHYNDVGVQLDNCEHGDNNQGRYTCPVLSGNATNGSGGAIYLTGNYDSKLNLYCCEEDSEHKSSAGLDNGQSDFMKVEGGKVVITASQTMSESDLNSQDAKHGNVKIQSTVYITGGQVDLWGDMQNPSFENIITVDVTKEGDYFEDHRLFDVYYKLTYYENFKDPVTGHVTGQYKETKVKKGEEETISANIYEHPGYKIVGWNTDRYGSPTGTWYKPGVKYTFDGDPIGDLTIYAIWEANGYDVIFNPNVPEGEKYTGVMANQSLTYDVWEELNPNTYKRPGYIFSGWSTEAIGSVEYEDKASVKNLTTQIGVPVELFAVWSKCDHDITNHEYTYSVIDDGKTLKRECECEGYSETALLEAEDAVYDKSEHPASVTYPSGWQGDKPVIVYKKEDALSDVPINAGTYTANISAGGKTASVTYIIEKAPQSAPDKPEYDTDGEGGDQIKVHPINFKVNDDPTYDSNILYKVVYYVGSERKEESLTWNPRTEPSIDGLYAKIFDLDVALTNYYVYASYTEGTNYKASEETMADGTYWFTGNVDVTVISGEGIIHNLQEATEGSDLTGINVKLSLKDGYYLPKEHNVTIETKAQEDSTVIEPGAKIQKVDGSNGLEYKIEFIPKNCKLIITIQNAKKAASVSTKIDEDEVFGAVTGNEAVISRDSAYTSYFEVKDYDAGAYSGIDLIFDTMLPSGTTMIMVDKTSGSNKYYKHILTGYDDTIPLTEFIEMESNSSYELTSGNKNIQFIIDFSDIINDNLVSKEALDTKLKLKSNGVAPDLEAAVNVELKDVSVFQINTSEEASDTVSLELIHTESEGVASKWNNRNAALVLVPDTPMVGLELNKLPQNARIKCYDGTSTIIINRNNDGNFIIPLGDLADRELTLTLESPTLAPYATYNMDANWIVAESLAGSAPINGELVQTTDIDFEIGAMGIPSIRIEPPDNTDASAELFNGRLYTVDDTLNVNVQWRNIDAEDKVTVDLLRKGMNGEYVDTAVGEKNLNTGTSITYGEFSTGLNLAVNDTAKYQSYCLRVRVMDGLVKTAETNYYFIVEKTET